MVVHLGPDGREGLLVPYTHVLQHKLRVTRPGAPREANGRIGPYQIDTGKTALAQKALDGNKVGTDTHAHARLQLALPLERLQRRAGHGRCYRGGHDGWTLPRLGARSARGGALSQQGPSCGDRAATAPAMRHA